MKIIDTPQYFRLRDLKQLGLTHLVYPSATHTRFEHSLGVGYLSGSLAGKLRKNQKNLGLTKNDVELITIAGLCHDLGHGPFSHAFETWIHRKYPNFKHEEMSEKLFIDLVDENGIDLEKKDINFVVDLILGNRKQEKAFLYDIVSNSKSSLDVDKLDYLTRDSHHVGISNGNNYLYERLFNNCRVINDEICYNAKVSYDIWQVFSQRYDMFKQVYCHRVSLAIEGMIADVFDLADEHLQISQKIFDIKEYTNLTDSVLNTIQCSKIPELERARNLIKRVQKRQLYKYVEQHILPLEEYNKVKDFLTPEYMIQYKPANSKLQVSDIFMRVNTMTFASGGYNPLQNIRFYNKHDIDNSFQLDWGEISQLLPSRFSEKCVSLFCKENDPTLHQDIQSMLRKFTQENQISSPGKKDFISPQPNKGRQGLEIYDF